MSAPRPAGRPLSLAAYGVASALLAPLAGPILEARARRGKEDPARLSERLGRPSAARPAGPLVWLHAVSVGESLSLLPLVERLGRERPDLGLMMTSGTRASAEVLAPRLPRGAIHQFAPVDTPGVVRRFLDHWRPDVGLFAESELWPNLILEARRRGTRLALLSARMTERSTRNWARRPGAARAVLSAFELILAQDSATETRLLALGGRVGGRLNLKLAGAAPGADPAQMARLKAQLGARAVVLAVSTHAPEERLIADAVLGAPEPPMLIIAPRHPRRAEEIVGQLAGRRLTRRSAGETPRADAEIYLADTLGEMGLLLRVADVAVMGGSFGEGIGGHNPLEPARLGVPVVTGPDIANAADLYAELVEAGGALALRDAAALGETVAALLGDEARRRRMGLSALAYAERQASAFEAGLDLIRPLLPPP